MRTVALVAALSAAWLPALWNHVVRADQPASGAKAVVAQPADASSTANSWLDEYLASELQYNAEQIRQFKQNVAKMPADELRALVQRIKQFRPYREAERARQLELQRQTRQRLREARATALARPAVPATHAFVVPRIRYYDRDPARYGLFKGYIVVLGRD